MTLYDKSWDEGVMFLFQRLQENRGHPEEFRHQVKWGISAVIVGNRASGHLEGYNFSMVVFDNNLTLTVGDQSVIEGLHEIEIDWEWVTNRVSKALWNLELKHRVSGQGQVLGQVSSYDRLAQQNHPDQLIDSFLGHIVDEVVNLTRYYCNKKRGATIHVDGQSYINGLSLLEHQYQITDNGFILKFWCFGYELSISPHSDYWYQINNEINQVETGMFDGVVVQIQNWARLIGLQGAKK